MSNIIFNKKTIVCPVCGKTAREIPIFNGFTYSCDNCSFMSIDPKCVDVSYKDELSAPLSNLYPNSFKMHCSYSNITLGRALVTYPSMETFLQSLKIKDPSLQYYFIKNYSAMDAKKMSAILDGWKKEQLLYFDGKAYARDSEDYLKLITTAYDALYEKDLPDTRLNEIRRDLLEDGTFKFNDTSYKDICIKMMELAFEENN